MTMQLVAMSDEPGCYPEWPVCPTGVVMGITTTHHLEYDWQQWCLININSVKNLMAVIEHGFSMLAIVCEYLVCNINHHWPYRLIGQHPSPSVITPWFTILNRIELAMINNPEQSSSSNIHPTFINYSSTTSTSTIHQSSIHPTFLNQWTHTCLTLAVILACARPLRPIRSKLQRQRPVNSWPAARACTCTCQADQSSVGLDEAGCLVSDGWLVVFLGFHRGYNH